MSILAKIIQAFLGTPPKSLLKELFQNKSQATIGIVLEETGFPYGGVTIYTWWNTGCSGYFTKTHQDFNSSISEASEAEAVRRETSHVDRLVGAIENSGCLENYLNKMRDGVVYRLFWGTAENQHELTIDNPVAGSDHYQLIAQLKENAQE